MRASELLLTDHQVLIDSAILVSPLRLFLFCETAGIKVIPWLLESMSPDGTADRSKQLREGDRILEINSLKCPHEDTVERICATSLHIQLTIERMFAANAFQIPGRRTLDFGAKQNTLRKRATLDPFLCCSLAIPHQLSVQTCGKKTPWISIDSRDGARILGTNSHHPFREYNHPTKKYV